MSKEKIIFKTVADNIDYRSLFEVRRICRKYYLGESKIGTPTKEDIIYFLNSCLDHDVLMEAYCGVFEKGYLTLKEYFESGIMKKMFASFSAETCAKHIVYNCEKYILPTTKEEFKELFGEIVPRGIGYKESSMEFLHGILSCCKNVDYQKKFIDDLFSEIYFFMENNIKDLSRVFYTRDRTPREAINSYIWSHFSYIPTNFLENDLKSLSYSKNKTLARIDTIFSDYCDKSSTTISQIIEEIIPMMSKNIYVGEDYFITNINLLRLMYNKIEYEFSHNSFTSSIRNKLYRYFVKPLIGENANRTINKISAAMFPNLLSIASVATPAKEEMAVLNMLYSIKQKSYSNKEIMQKFCNVRKYYRITTSKECIIAQYKMGLYGCYMNFSNPCVRTFQFWKELCESKEIEKVFFTDFGHNPTFLENFTIKEEDIENYKKILNDITGREVWYAISHAFNLSGKAVVAFKDNLHLDYLSQKVLDKLTEEEIEMAFGDRETYPIDLLHNKNLSSKFIYNHCKQLTNERGYKRGYNFDNVSLKELVAAVE